jgi:hypothetical protein
VNGGGFRLPNFTKIIKSYPFKIASFASFILNFVWFKLTNIWLLGICLHYYAMATFVMAPYYAGKDLGPPFQLVY